MLLALRPDHLHQGGLWEFPGGKVEADEEVLAALKRELCEELGITVISARPLIRIRHHYPDKAVLLDVWRVDGFTGQAVPHAAQRLEWIKPEDLMGRNYPAANLPILAALRLPFLYLISGEPTLGVAHFLEILESCLRGGAQLIQLRAKTLDEAAYRVLAQQVQQRCRQHGAKLLLNAIPEVAQELGADGVHLSSQRLMKLATRPMGKDKWVAASCHNAQELAHAEQIGVDFVVVSPVLPTRSHSGAAHLGWEGLRTLTEQARMPVYGLGGLGLEHLNALYQNGAQGVALLSRVWDATDPEKILKQLT